MPTVPLSDSLQKQLAVLQIGALTTLQGCGDALPELNKSARVMHESPGSLNLFRNPACEHFVL